MLKSEQDSDFLKAHFCTHLNLSGLIDTLESCCDGYEFKEENLDEWIETCAKNSDQFELLNHDVFSDLRDFLLEMQSVIHQIKTLKDQGQSPVEIAHALQFKRLFKGANGVGITYYRATKKR